jgi:hypothetical protein
MIEEAGEGDRAASAGEGMTLGRLMELFLLRKALVDMSTQASWGAYLNRGLTGRTVAVHADKRGIGAQ